MKTLKLKNILFLCFILVANSVYADSETNYLMEKEESVKFNDEDVSLVADKVKIITDKKLDIKLYYETLCPASREFESIDLRNAIEQLNKYLDIKTFPYGNAKMVVHNGTVEFTCQHGPKECYGNKLHACALDLVQNHTAALLYNSCLMSFLHHNSGSDDAAADKCGSSMSIDSGPIKECAKGEKGNELLKYYGEESEKAKFHYVPYVLINGEVWSGDDFIEDICAILSNRPPPCAQL